MKNGKNSFSKLQLRYFASYVAIMLIVMIALISYTYRSFSDLHAKILLNGYQANLHLMEETLEQSVSTLISIAGQMTNNDITPFKYAENPGKASRISGKLTSYRAVSDTVSEVFVHFSGDDYVYSSTSFFLMDHFVTQALQLAETTPDALRTALESTAFLTVWPSQRIQGYAVRSDTVIHHVVTVLVPLSYPGGARVGTVMYVIDEDVFFGWLKKLGLGQTNVIIAYKGIPILQQAVSDAAEVSLLAVEQTNTGKVSINNQSYHVLRDDGSGNLSCAAFVPDQEMQLAMSNSVKALVLVSAVIAAVSILIITRIVQSRMKGIKLLHSMLADHDPTGDELLEIRDGIQRLIDENALMTTKLEDMSGAQKSEFVRKFLLGGFEDEDAFLQTAETVGVNVDTQYFAVCIIAKAAESSYELNTEKIDRLFDESVSGASLSLISPESHLVMVAFCNDPERLRSFLESKFSGLKACSASITMGISHFHTSWTEGQRAYLEAENAFEMRFVKGSTDPLFFADIEENQIVEPDDNRQAVEHLRHALHRGDAQRVNLALREVSQAMHDTRSSLFGFRCMYSEIITAISSEARASGVNEEELYDLFRLSRCLSVDELDGILNHACQKIIALQNMPAQEEIPTAVRQARDIIQHRFSEPGLTVSGIAEEVGMSDSKLSVEFKRIYHETPLECITSSRMHRAQRLLRTTEMPVKDIATECGYYDISAFNRRFKSYTGCTPQQFRQRRNEDPSPDDQ